MRKRRVDKLVLAVLAVVDLLFTKMGFGLTLLGDSVTTAMFTTNFHGVSKI